jgi:hypothetical protein
MEADPADFDPRTCIRASVQQAQKPRQRCTERAAIAQFHPHRMVVKSDGRCRNAHPKLSK